MDCSGGVPRSQKRCLAWVMFWELKCVKYDLKPATSWEARGNSTCIIPSLGRGSGAYFLLRPTCHKIRATKKLDIWTGLSILQEGNRTKGKWMWKMFKNSPFHLLERRKRTLRWCPSVCSHKTQSQGHIFATLKKSLLSSGRDRHEALTGLFSLLVCWSCSLAYSWVQGTNFCSI